MVLRGQCVLGCPIVHRPPDDLYILTGPCSILDQPCGYDQSLGCACLGQPSGVRVRVYPLFLCPSSLLDPRLFFYPRGPSPVPLLSESHGAGFKLHGGGGLRRGLEKMKI